MLFCTNYMQHKFQAHQQWIPKFLDKDVNYSLSLHPVNSRTPVKRQCTLYIYIYIYIYIYTHSTAKRYMANAHAKPFHAFCVLRRKKKARVKARVLSTLLLLLFNAVGLLCSW